MKDEKNKKLENSIDDKISVEKRNKLVEQVLDTAKSKILTNMRFMDSSIFALPCKRVNTGFYTDGKNLCYSNQKILEFCKDQLARVTHSYMHILLHCIFRHHIIHGKINRQRWDLSCDIAVEFLIASFKMKCFEDNQQLEREQELKRIKYKRGKMTAETLYRSLTENPLTLEEKKYISILFFADDHNPWYMKKRAFKEEQMEEMQDKDLKNEKNDQVESEKEKKITQTKDKVSDLDEGRFIESETDWEKISEMLKTKLETSNQDYKVESGQLLAELEMTQERKMDYETFLRKFAQNREVRKVDESSFDYIFYTYGMKLYKDMPLIEPLEYSSEKRIQDLVIAIDTSGSTDGPLVQKFIRKSFDILQNTKIVGSKFHIHILQCDASIQEDILIESQNDVEFYLNNMKIKGLGGTDFRPVFRYVDKLVAEGDLKNLKGILYFTDGKGIFPKHKPAYDTAFIFIGDTIDVDVPPWAMKVFFDDNLLQ